MIMYETLVHDPVYNTDCAWWFLVCYIRYYVTINQVKHNEVVLSIVSVSRRQVSTHFDSNLLAVESIIMSAVLFSYHELSSLPQLCERHDVLL